MTTTYYSAQFRPGDYRPRHRKRSTGNAGALALLAGIWLCGTTVGAILTAGVGR